MKKNLSKLLVLLLALTMVLAAFASCKKDDDKDKESKEPTESVEPVASKDGSKPEESKPTEESKGPKKVVTNSIIMGNTTDLSGSFRFAGFGKGNPLASDNDIEALTHGLGTVESNIEGAFAWNPTVVEEHSEQMNDDGSKTFTIKIKNDLVFSDGSPITAKNYLVKTLVFATPVSVEGAKYDHQAGMNLVGFEDYHGAAEAVPFKGLRLIDDYTFAATIAPDYIPYYYDITYASFGPDYLPMWLGPDCDIKDDGEGAYITGDFFKKEGESYVMAKHLDEAHNDITTYPYSGPYVVSEWNAADKSATLKINKNFKGNPDGIKPSIETITYIKMVSETQNQQLEAGELDLLTDITGGDDTNAALAIVKKHPDDFNSTYYDRAGYGKLGFRADFGPVYFKEVRQAIMYSIDRNAFAQQFTGGYGAVVHGPYYQGSAAYHANEDDIILNNYAVSEASAKGVLEEGGWIYNAKGEPYTEGVRYKKLAKSECTKANLTYKSQDGAYKVEKVGEDYYMPLAVNWFCTADNNVSEMLKTAWANSDITKNIGMVVQFTQGAFPVLIAELQQDEAAGYKGPPLFSAFNFATGFSSAVYDFAFNWSVDPAMWDWSAFYILDDADRCWKNGIDGKNLDKPLDEYEYGKDFDALYDTIGDKVTADMVEEDEDGLAFVEVDGKKYELGEDFLTMAMVYRTDPIEGNDDFDTADKIYNFWWKLYIQRWNYLAAEIPLYSNQYYHVFNAKLVDYVVSPYWGAANALPLARIDMGE